MAMVPLLHMWQRKTFFMQQKVPSLLALYPGAKSVLSSMMAASNMTNPFSDLYSAISSWCVSPTTSMTATMFFLFAHEPAGKLMALSMCRDVTVEKVLGIALWSYWEAGKHKRMLTIDRLYIHMHCTLEIPVLAC